MKRINYEIFSARLFSVFFDIFGTDLIRDDISQARIVPRSIC